MSDAPAAGSVSLRSRHCVWVVILGSWAIGCAHRESAPPPPAASPSLSPSASASEQVTAEPARDTDEPDRECGATVHAPIDVVRRVLTSYDDYATILPKFGRSRVLKRTAGSADVYLQVPILRGVAHLWAVVRFVGPVVKPYGERIEGTYLHEGNVSNFHCLWTYRRVSDKETELHLGLLVLPKIPLPGSVIESELSNGCRDAVGGVKAYAEARAAP